MLKFENHKFIALYIWSYSPTYNSIWAFPIAKELSISLSWLFHFALFL